LGDVSLDSRFRKAAPSISALLKKLKIERVS
jgi:hypothetical protein